MTFDEMNPLQRRLHNAALVIEAEGDDHGFAKLQRDAIAALQPNTQEPVAWQYKKENGGVFVSDQHPPDVEMWHCDIVWNKPLYTHPAPQAKPLTNEQINDLMQEADAKWSDADVPMHWARHFARAIEAANGVKPS